MENIFLLPLERLKKTGVRGLVFDLDNTLTEWHNPSIGGKTLSFIASVKEGGFKACLLSNNSNKRVAAAAEKLGLPFVKNARKPSVKGFLNACKLLAAAPKETAMVGDQIFTDILGARRAGLYAVLVRPVAPREMWGTKHISRRMERLLWARIMANMPALTSQIGD